MVYSTLESTFAAAWPCRTISFSNELVLTAPTPTPFPGLSDWHSSLLCSGYFISSYTLVYWWLALTLFLNTLNPELPKNALFSLILWLFDTFWSHHHPHTCPIYHQHQVLPSQLLKKNNLKKTDGYDVANEKQSLTPESTGWGMTRRPKKTSWRTGLSMHFQVPSESYNKGIPRTLVLSIYRSFILQVWQEFPKGHLEIYRVWSIYNWLSGSFL